MPNSVKTFEREAVEALAALLDQSAALEVGQVRLGGRPAADMGVDAMLAAKAGRERFQFLIQCKSRAQPKQVGLAIFQLQRAARKFGKRAVLVLVAPYLSEQSRALCRDSGVCFLDFEGNALLTFGPVFIERIVKGKPPTERRELKSLYRPKAARVLRTLFRGDIGRSWRMVDLAKAAGVSLGHVSNVRTALVERELAQITAEGLRLTAPAALLDDWRDIYDGRSASRFAYYTTLHGEAFGWAAREALRAANKAGQAAFSSFSAAQWLAPYARTGVHYFFADEAGRAVLEGRLRLQRVSQGENVVIAQPGDDGVFCDVVVPEPGIVCTSAIQTYLDLASAGERGQEAAEHLRKEKLKWPH